MVKLIICPGCKTNDIKHHAKNLCKECYNYAYLNKICSICHNKNKIVKTDLNICNKCYQKTYKRKIFVCSICNMEKEIKKREKDGSPICSQCYQKSYVVKKKICSICGENKQTCVKKHNICKTCYNRTYNTPIEICTWCNRAKNVSMRLDDVILCSSCYVKYRLQTDEIFRIKYILRKRLRNILKYKNIKKIDNFGIDYGAIITHLGPCPGNYKDYHIDHIIPLHAFDFNNLIHIKAAFSPENHQWLIKEENLKKSGKYNKEDFEKYLNKFLGDLNGHISQSI